MKRYLAAAIVVALAAAPAWACGPDFPQALLDDRPATLGNLPEGVFTEEAAALVPAPEGKFKAVERADWIGTEPPPDRDAIEREMLGENYERMQAIREGAETKSAYAASEGLPEDVRRYLAGAVAFEHLDLDEAAHRFASVLELPANERVRYGVWAAYMLGRTEARRGNAAKAEAAFQHVRAIVAGGAADPLGMAVDSYGEEAKLHLDQGDDPGAVALYAPQAALGSRFAQASLLLVARAVVADAVRLDRDIADPLTQRLIAVYLLTRSGELGTDWVDTTARSAPAAATVIERFIGAIEKRGLERVAGADKLAALAYRSGRYDLAGRFAAKDASGLAAWVRAKLALRAGDATAAAAAYAEAAKAFPATPAGAPRDEDGSAPASSYCRVQGEAGTLALERGEYVAALEHLYAAAPTFWVDAAFVAERVLTLDELKQFVDTHAARPAKSGARSGALSAELPATLIRQLLARRLLREERYDEAIEYFDDPALEGKAAAYIAARRAAESGGRIERARAWYDAAVIARRDGIDLIGYELEPDNQYAGGDFELPYVFGYEKPVHGDAGDAGAPKPAVVAIGAGPSAQERDRVASSVARPDARFHYRYVAADFAARAAELVPYRSQAYAATLCAAAGWLVFRDIPAARVYYERYVKNGPYVPWAENFGTQCEKPDFDGAAKRLRAERIAAARRLARKAFPYVAAFGLFVVVGSGLWWRRRKTRIGMTR